jgi:hypothetical protein
LIHPLVFTIEIYLVFCEVRTYYYYYYYYLSKISIGSNKDSTQLLLLARYRKNGPLPKALTFSLPNALPHQNPDYGTEEEARAM